MPFTPEHADIVIVGSGAAGLMAGIWAGRTNPHRSIVILDGAQKPGAKILVAGGGRCNVTHDQVDAQAYAGSSRHAIRKVLLRFDVPHTIGFFREIGVDLKREATSKLFPTTDSARTVLNALLGALEQANASLIYPCRVENVQKVGDCFIVAGPWGQMKAAKVVLATGGKSLPKSGSDGHGYWIAQALGHHLTGRIFPALVPLTLPHDHFICGLSGLTVMATLDLRSATGKRLISFTDSTLCAHFGLSGPSVLDISRYYIDASLDDPHVALTINWLPGKTPDGFESELQMHSKASVLKMLCRELPERLVRALCTQAGVAPGTLCDGLSRDQRKRLAGIVTQCPLPITGDRGFNVAEVTAGGIPLSEIHLETMESRVCPGLYLCGEICDVDGRIGGYNFQWAWASGYTAGISV